MSIKKKLYVVHAEGGTDPSIHGPFKTEEERDNEARRLRNEDEEDIAFWLDISPSGKPTIGAYSGGFMEGLLGFTR